MNRRAQRPVSTRSVKGDVSLAETVTEPQNSQSSVQKHSGGCHGGPSPDRR